MAGFKFLVWSYFLALPYPSQQLGFNESCSLEQDVCDKEKFLQCGFFSRLCECHDPLNTVYVPSDDTCKKLVGTPCTMQPGSQACLDNGYCPDPDVPNPTCQCRPGFESFKKHCFLPYDSKCEWNEGFHDCNMMGFHNCSRYADGFYCQCQNFENAYYDSVRNTCYLRAQDEVRCGLSPDVMQCVDHAFCEINTRRCICAESYEEDPNGRCFLPFNSVCDPYKDECNIAGYQSCKEGYCSCLPDGGKALYYEKEKTCRLGHGSGCSVLTGSQRCVDRAACVEAQEEEPFRCQCLYTLRPNKYGECYRGPGDPCDDNTECDPTSYLICDAQHRCVCPENSYLDSQKGECFLKLGSPCRTTEMSCGNSTACENGVCRCADGYEDSGNESCKLGYGQACTANSECNARNNLFCNYGTCDCLFGLLPSESGSAFHTTCFPGHGLGCPFGELQLPCKPDANLKCTDNLCLCPLPNQQVWLKEESRCASYVGGDCDPQMDYLNRSMCVPNASCKYSSPNSGFCECDIGYKLAFNIYCVNSSYLISKLTPLMLVLVGLISLRV